MPGSVGLSEGLDVAAMGQRQVAEGREITGQPWFEEIIEGSELGRIRRRRGGKSSSDGRSRVEWEIVEFEGEAGEESMESGMGNGKRKIGDVAGVDVDMRGGH